MIAFGIYIPSYGQDSQAQDLRFSIEKNYPGLTLTSEEIRTAQSIACLNRFFDPEWIAEYRSVEIYTWQDGKKRISQSLQNQLTEDQKQQLLEADPEAEVNVAISYVPKNELKDNDVHEINFSFSQEPDVDAQFEGVMLPLDEYIQQYLIDALPSHTMSEKDVVAIRFTVNKEGKVINPHVYSSMYQAFENDELEQHLMQGLEAMPCWQAARYADGTAVDQPFALFVGHLESCLVNLPE